jgi:hypothetical protein
LRPSYAVVFNEPKIKLKMSFLKIKFPELGVRLLVKMSTLDKTVSCAVISSGSIDGRGDPLDHTDGERGKKNHQICQRLRSFLMRNCGMK